MRTQPTGKETGIAAALLLAVLLGCGTVKKAQECKELTTKVNAAVAEIQALNTGQNDPKQLAKMADAAEKHADELSKMKIEHEDLKAPVESYVQMWRDMAKYSRQAVDALGSQDLKSGLEAANKLKEVTSQESQLVNQLNTACSEM